MLFAPDQVTIEYRGLAGSYQPDSIPQAAIGKLLVEAITLFRQGKGVEMSLNGTTLEVQGKLKEKGDSLYVDNGCPDGTPLYAFHSCQSF